MLTSDITEPDVQAYRSLGHTNNAP